MSQEGKFIQQSVSKRPKASLVFIFFVLFLSGWTYYSYLPAYYEFQLQKGMEMASELAVLRFTPQTYSMFVVARDVIVTFVFFVTALSILQRNWKNSFVHFISLVLITAGVTFPNTMKVPLNNDVVFYVSGVVRYTSQAMFLLFLFTFPNGEFYPHRLRKAFLILFPLLTAFPFFGNVMIPVLKEPLRSIESILETLFLLAGVISLIFRYRRKATVVEKQQVKWIVFGFTLVMIGAFIINIGRIVLNSLIPPQQAYLIYDLIFITFFGATAASFFPMMIAFSVTRHRLWDLAEVSNRSLVVGVIGFLVLVLATGIGLFLEAFTHMLFGESSQIHLILTTVIVALLTRPLYNRGRLLADQLVSTSKINIEQEVFLFSQDVQMVFDQQLVARKLLDKIGFLLDLRYCAVFQTVERGGYETLSTRDIAEDQIVKEELNFVSIEKLESGQILQREECQFVILVPIVREEHHVAPEVIAFVAVGPKKTGRGFSRIDQDLLIALTQEASRALAISSSQAQINLLATALESAANGVGLINEEGNVTWVNRAFCELTGFQLEEVRGGKFSVLSSVMFDYSEQVWQTVQNRQTWFGEGISKRKGGEEYYEEVTMTPVIAPDGKISHFVMIKNDVSKQVKIQQQFLELATHDALTGLPNRLLFNDRLEHALALASRNGKKGAVFFLDLDDFKQINDVYTHDRGDAILKIIGTRLENVLRQKDTISRIGGDEFAMIIEDLEQTNEAGIFAQKVLDEVSKLIEHEGVVFHLSGSIGISIFPDDGDNLSELVQNADIAMYRAKDKGKNSYEFFTSAMSEEVASTLEVRNLLRNARQGENLLLVFQPIIDLKTGKTTMIEALLRLEHPEKGMLSPAHFLDLAEKSAYMIEIGEWVIKRTLEVGEILQEKQGQDFQLSINISPSQLRNPDFRQNLERILERSSFPATSLVFEITEKTLLGNTEEDLKVIQAVKELGIQLAIDDFGTGYSSLSSLARFPFDVLKIDKEFVKDLLDKPESIALLDGVLEIAKNLNMEVIIEGVETDHQLDHFVSRDVNAIQGYLFSRPVGFSELGETLEKLYL